MIGHRATCLLVIFWAALRGFVATATEPADGPSVLRHVAEIRQLSVEEARRGHLVVLEATITYSDPVGPLLFVQDATGGIYVSLLDNQLYPAAGQRVRIQGVARPGQYLLPYVAEAMLAVVGPGKLPEPPQRSLQDLANGADDAQFVQVEGTIRAVIDRGANWELAIATGSGQLSAGVLATSKDPGLAPRLLDAKIRAQGVLVVRTSPQKVIQSLALLVPRPANLFVEIPGPEDPYSPPFRPIRAVSMSEANPAQRVHVKGEIESRTTNGILVIKDGDARLRVRPFHDLAARPGDQLEAAGFPDHDANGVSLTNAIARVLAAPRANPGKRQPGALSNAPAGQTLPLLDAARDVRRLPPNLAELGYPVRLHGVVTYADRARRQVFVQDDTGGIEARAPEVQPDVEVGNVVEIEGFTETDGFTTRVSISRFRTAGKDALPEPSLAPLDQVLAGAEDAQWVGLSGVIRSASIEGGRLTLDFVEQGRRLKAVLPANRPAPPVGWVDAAAQLQGVCSAQFGPRGRLTAVQLLIPSKSFVRVVTPGAVDPFELPTEIIANVLRSVPGDEPIHRRKTRGVVTFQSPGKALYLHDGTGNVCVRSPQLTPLELGDEVEVVGFPGAAGYLPGIEDAVYRKVGVGRQPTPLALRADQALSLAPDGELVKVEGYFQEELLNGSESALALESGDRAFHAELEKLPASVANLRLTKGALVAVTGVCSIRADAAGKPDSFRILLRSADDLVVLKRPSWWTWRRTSLASGLLSALFLAAAAWAVTLKTRLGVETSRIRRDLERKAAAEERFRALVDNASDIVYTHDLEGHFVSLNRSGEEFFGYPSGQMGAMKLSQIMPPDQLHKAQQMTRKKLSEGGRTAYELEVFTRGEQRRTIEVSSWLVQRDGKPFEVQGIARDITKRKQSEALLEASLREKEMLLKEIHHRVKNNMQVVSSLLKLQADRVKDPEILALLQQSQTRVKSMALIHQKLYQSRNLAQVDFAEYIRSLVNMMAVSYRSSSVSVKTELNLAPLLLGIDTAIPVGLILNELVANAFKYAFRKTKTGRITVDFRPESGQVILAVRDDGQGLPEDFTLDQSNTLGMHLVKILTAQVGGQISFRNQGGAEFTVIFPLERKH